MKRIAWVMLTAILALIASGCERTEQQERAQERTNLPAVNERIEREADQGDRPGRSATESEREAQQDAGQRPADAGNGR